MTGNFSDLSNIRMPVLHSETISILKIDVNIVRFSSDFRRFYQHIKR